MTNTEQTREDLWTAEDVATYLTCGWTLSFHCRHIRDALSGEPLVLRAGRQQPFSKLFVKLFLCSQRGGQQCTMQPLHAEGMSLMPRGDSRAASEKVNCGGRALPTIPMPGPTGLMQLMSRGQAFNMSSTSALSLNFQVF